MASNLTNEMRLLGTFDRGIPNQERIVLEADAKVNFAEYLIVLAQRQQSTGAIFPYRDYLYWFGNIITDQLTRIYLYTGQGQYRLTTVQGTNIPAHVFHWDKPQTLFADTSVLPTLVRIQDVIVENPPQNVSQLLLSR